MFREIPCPGEQSCDPHTKTAQARIDLHSIYLTYYTVAGTYMYMYMYFALSQAVVHVAADNRTITQCRSTCIKNKPANNYVQKKAGSGGCE